jgi:long-chain fatty acid transport protein
MKQAGGLQYNVRAGWWWRPSPRLSVGAVYQTETQSDFEDGDTWVDFRSLFGQKVTYTSDVEGFTYAAQAGVGFALRPDDRWTWALDIKRYFWDDAIDVITVTARDPDLAVAPPELVFPFVFNWKDQWVLAVGADYRVNDRLTVRGGYNYGENPVPDETLTPLFPATVEHHLAAGFTWLSGSKSYELSVEHAFEKDQVNNNPDPRVNPFGPGSRVRHEQWTVSFSVSWAWARNGRG